MSGEGDGHLSCSGLKYQFPVINIPYSLPLRVRPALFITIPIYCPSVALTNNRGKYPRHYHLESRRRYMSRESTAVVAKTTAVNAELNFWDVVHNEFLDDNDEANDDDN